MIEERLDRIEQFLNEESVNVLLRRKSAARVSTCKSIIIVNYDLPWNPMVVEQRIGRIDRIDSRQTGWLL